MNRRDFLQVGAVGVGGFSLADYLRAGAAGQVRDSKATSAIFVFLGGGPSHMDTFDLKPDAAADVRGEFNPIDTNVAGVRISEHLPNLARCADKYAILRGVSHSVAAHELGTEYMNAGSRPVPSLVYPGYGAVVNKELSGAPDLPHFIAIPSTPQKAGYLGVRYAPLQTVTTPTPGQAFSVRGIAVTEGMTVEQFETRQRLLNRLDTGLAGMERHSALADGMDRFAQQAYGLITSPRARRAFDISQEPAAVSAPFGSSRFGTSCLLAVRLIEAGVRFATVTMSGWDTHGNNFGALKNGLLPTLDQGLSALFNTLSAKGLLASTAVFVTGEFGRTPKINDKAGRDHWPRAFTVLMGGGGIKTGQVLGASDARGMGPAAQPITPEQVSSSFYHSLGIDFRKEYHTPTGRPVMIVREGTVVPGLFA